LLNFKSINSAGTSLINSNRYIYRVLILKLTNYKISKQKYKQYGLHRINRVTSSSFSPTSTSVSDATTAALWSANDATNGSANDAANGSANDVANGSTNDADDGPASNDDNYRLRSSHGLLDASATLHSSSGLSYSQA
jgi:hypothetical protein